MIVTYNRPTVVNTLRILLRQTYPIYKIVIVDNSPSDAVVSAINKFKSSLSQKEREKIVIVKNSKNSGVGGGYSQGINIAINNKCDFAWLLDDDSIPSSDLLHRLVDCFDALKNKGFKVGIVAPSSYNPERDLYYHGLIRIRFGYVPADRVIKDIFSKPVIFVDSVIFSGMLLNLSAVKIVGFPRKDFLMDWVDHEFCYRIRRRGYIIVQRTDAILVHTIGKIVKTKLLDLKLSYHPPWRRYLYYRNRLYTHLYIEHDFMSLLRFFSLVLQYAVIYTLLFGQQKKAHLKAIIRGIYDGFFKNMFDDVDMIMKNFT